MSTVGLCIHSGRNDAVELAHTVGQFLADRGHTIVLGAVEAHLLDDVAHEFETGVKPLDLVIAFGGDGTMLRGTRRAVAAGADILGINLGELGYLAEVEPVGWEEALTAYFDGTHSIEDRMMVVGSTPAHPDLPPGLNEVVIEKKAVGRTVRLGVSIDGGFFTSYVADGLIVATPTGSTAYSLSARGPIVAPSHRALVMTPVSPHTLFDRSLILGPSSTVEVTVLGDRAATLSVDGDEVASVEVGEKVTIVAAPEPARFVTFGGRNFHQILKAKFGLSDR